MDEVELIHHILKGNQQDYALIINRYQQNVFRTVMGLLHNKEDCRRNYAGCFHTNSQFTGTIRE